MMNNLELLKSVLSVPSKTYQEDLLVKFICDWLEENKIPFYVDKMIYFCACNIFVFYIAFLILIAFLFAFFYHRLLYFLVNILLVILVFSFTIYLYKNRSICQKYKKLIYFSLFCIIAQYNHQF